MKDRDFSIDLIKIVAMFGVISLHCTHSFVSESSMGIADVLYDSAVVSIPLFFMVSGFLLLGREYISWAYVLRKVMGIIRFVFIVVFLYWFVYSCYNDEFKIDSFVRYFAGAFMQRGPLWMFWYFGSMIMIYILLPALNSVYNGRSVVKLLPAAVFLLLAMHVVFICNILSDDKPLESNVIQCFRMYSWLFYFLCGGLIKKAGKRISVSGGVIVALFIFNILYERQLGYYMHSTFCEYYYSSLVVIVLSICLFFYIQGKTYTPIHPYVKELSKLFLPVYTLHIFVIKTYIHYVPIYIFGIISPLAAFALCSIATVIISWGIMKVPYVNKIFRI